MGFFYKKHGNDTTFGYKLTIKFGGKNNEKEDSVNNWPSRILEILKAAGVSIIQESDNDPNKDKRIL